MKFVCYPKCTTCQKAKRWLNENGFNFVEKDIKLNNPQQNELQEWYAKSNLPIKRFFNTSGQKYRELGLSKKLDKMTDDEKLSLLATDGMLVKRPILIYGDLVLVGFKEAEWSDKLL